MGEVENVRGKIETAFLLDKWACLFIYIYVNIDHKSKHSGWTNKFQTYIIYVPVTISTRVIDAIFKKSEQNEVFRKSIGKKSMMANGFVFCKSNASHLNM